LPVLTHLIDGGGGGGKGSKVELPEKSEAGYEKKESTRVECGCCSRKRNV